MILDKKRLLLKNARNDAGIFFILVLIFSCAAPQTNQLKQERPLDLTHEHLIQDVPFYPQENYHCGPATLAMAISYHGDKITPTTIAKDVFTPELKGSLQIEMQAAARKHGMLAHVLTPELVYLLAEVSVGHPVIVLQNLSVKLYPVWHYALVIGYNLEKNSIILHTGKNSNYELPLHTFEHTWKRSNYWALVVLPPSILPNDRNLKNVLQAAVDLENVGQIKHANKAYQAILKRWPENIVALMGAGNTFLKLNKPENATIHYLQAIRIRPNNANIYNNLAYSLQSQHCNMSAFHSIQCAILLEPDNMELKKSLNEISISKQTTSSDKCPVISCPK